MLLRYQLASSDGDDVMVEVDTDESFTRLSQKIQDIKGLPPSGSIFVSNPAVLVLDPQGTMARVGSKFIPARESSRLEGMGLDTFQRILDFVGMKGLVALRCTRRAFYTHIEDQKLWRKCLHSRKPKTSQEKAARRIFNEIILDVNVNGRKGWLSVFSTRMQAYHIARRLWKHIVSNASMETKTSLRGPSSEMELRVVEEHSGWRIPLEVRSSLMVCNGQDVMGTRKGLIVGLKLLSCSEIWNEMRFRPEVNKRGLLPITKASGHQQICARRDGKIVLLEGHEIKLKAKTFFHLLAKLYVEESDPLWDEIDPTRRDMKLSY
ncbi:hypothetical protein AAMO2058_001431400 [Amorphochlora amoebiformis]|uniref:Knr4/Smi1-like domain-containing protein n=1 Tax=Amorphochlora amoebiformis TaxID=1561963 RepID=A0A7S0DC09_9EUKA|mmetsp:Transcript_23451/g.36838  ORF Transcript_23451/g.36838 Transcript_23451/m.36838 type:complete len:321 (+) Transcript_23451:3-965(+)